MKDETEIAQSKQECNDVKKLINFAKVSVLCTKRCRCTICSVGQQRRCTSRFSCGYANAENITVGQLIIRQNYYP